MIYLQSPFTMGCINRQHHDNGAPVNIFGKTLYIKIILPMKYHFKRFNNIKGEVDYK